MDGAVRGTQKDDNDKNLRSSALPPVLNNAPKERAVEDFSHHADIRIFVSGSENEHVEENSSDLTGSIRGSARQRSSSHPVFNGETPLISNNSPPHRTLTSSNSLEWSNGAPGEVLKLSVTQLHDPVSAPKSLPDHAISTGKGETATLSDPSLASQKLETWHSKPSRHGDVEGIQADLYMGNNAKPSELPSQLISNDVNLETSGADTKARTPSIVRPRLRTRVVSTPLSAATKHAFSTSILKDSIDESAAPTTSRMDTADRFQQVQHMGDIHTPLFDSFSSSMPSSVLLPPLPPLSMPTYLQLELSSARPSPLYIHRSASSELSYESFEVKFGRLLNFFKIPYELEQVLIFGTLTCFDAWLYTFTILPLRVINALWPLLNWTFHMLQLEMRNIYSFLSGFGRQWHSHLQKAAREAPQPYPNTDAGIQPRRTESLQRTLSRFTSPYGHASTQPQKSAGPSQDKKRLQPSSLLLCHKADILQALLIVISCVILLRFDASRMYHAIRGQAAIKLYVIYNVLEVCDRLFSALGQDILECLFSVETLEPRSGDRNRLFRPFWLFIVALFYIVVHAMALFYQVVTLNVAVNSYSNALLTLLMSNQFVEIKSTVFKKFEKENLFQLTCADVVERFQLWIMLLVIALRNVVEVGGLSITFGSSAQAVSSTSPSVNSSTSGTPLYFGIIPNSYTLIPSLLPLQVLSPFLIVIGSEMLVDWLKHAYISKFNAVKPSVYSRFLDVLAKDYYSNAFSEQNLTRRLGLPVIPLACLFIRAMLQTYHMFLATNMSTAVSSHATALSLVSENATSPLVTQLDRAFKEALGRSYFGHGSSSYGFTWRWTMDDGIAFATTITFFLAVYLLLLALKLALGMLLLKLAHGRYKGMKKREQEWVVEPGTKRMGGWGVVEVGEDRRKWIYGDDADSLKTMKDREAREKDNEKEARKKGSKGLESVNRYSMVAKRIW